MSDAPADGRFLVCVPDIGDFEAVEVIEILVAPGDRVEVEDSLLSIESDKATMEIPAPRAGVVRELRVALGEKVSEGSPLLTLDVSAEAAERGPEPEAEIRAPEIGQSSVGPSPQASPLPAASALPQTSPSSAASALPHASPLVRKAARELGVDLGRPAGSGPQGRILMDDVKSYVRGALGEPARSGAVAGEPSAPDFARFGEVELQELTRIQRKAGANLARSWTQVPHVTQHDEADVSDLEEFRRSHAEVAAARGVKLTLLPFLMKAAVHALRAHPRLRSSLDPSGGRLIIKHYFHIGVAVDTENGLVVPVVRDVDQKSLLEIAAELADLSARARARKLTPQDLSGGCFSISSLGGLGGTAFTPIVNSPEVAILGVSRIATRAVWAEHVPGETAAQGFVPRRLLPLSLSYDHRVIDGAEAVRFTSRVVAALSNIAHLLL